SMPKAVSSRRSRAATRCRRWGAAFPSTCANWSRHSGSHDQVAIMERRDFLRTCALLGGAAGFAARSSVWADAAPRYYAKTRLIDIHGAPIRIGDLATETNYVFHYPYAATPCFLLKLGRRVDANPELRREDGSTYSWPGGVGPERNVVAFSAICAHK